MQMRSAVAGPALGELSSQARFTSISTAVTTKCVIKKGQRLNRQPLMSAVLLFWVIPMLQAAEHRGQVKFGSQPVPGASVTLEQSGQQHAAITNAQGAYRIDGIDDKPFTVQVEFQLFAPQRREFANPGTPGDWELELLPPDQLTKHVVRKKAAFQRTEVSVSKVPRQQEASSSPPVEVEQQANDGFLINGSVNNAASSPFAQLPAFGNNRRGHRSLYSGNLGLILNNSAFDARSFSLTGQNTPKPSYSRVQGLFAFGGPLRLPYLLNHRGPVFSINYQWTRNGNATAETGLMPTELDRRGVFFSQPIVDPMTGAPFAGNRIPATRISPQANALLRLYPLPNFDSDSRYNFQVPVVRGQHQDDLQTRVNKQVGRNFITGNFNGQRTRTSTPDIFAFLDTGSVQGWNATAGYRRMLNSRSFFNVSLSYNRLTTRVTPYFSNRENVSSEAGISGNNQEPVNWGPPNLDFSNGITPLIVAQASLTRNQTAGISVDAYANRGRHNLTTGFTLRRQQFNVLAQQNARGTFGFTGATAGNDFAGFLLGVPDTSTVAFGNADKYLRGSIVESFVNDDWRVNPMLTINAGIRWEYWSPVRERYGRLVNLDIARGFASAKASSTLPRPDRDNFAPRVAFSLRPFAASSFVIRGGYGVYYDASIYQPIAMEMAQQAPLSKSLRVSNSPAIPLTLASAFPVTALTTVPTFAVDPNFHTGYAHVWRLTLQTDLRGALQLSATYEGSKGTHGQQRTLPNTFPLGAIDPSGFVYLASNGSSSRHAAQLQLRRRMRSGLTAEMKYTWAKALDNALLGERGRVFIAQNWLDLDAERGRSNFDQRHAVTANFQYTTGMGLRGGALMRGWPALLFKEWTIGSVINWGTGFPLSPLDIGAVRGTGFTGTLRPDYTGLSIYDAPAGLHLNPAAIAEPQPGAWGNAGRNSITGPRQLVINSSLGRTFRSTERLSFDFRIDATNATNTPTFTSWNTVLGNPQFGLPNAVNAMRAVQMTIRTRF